MAQKPDPTRRLPSLGLFAAIAALCGLVGGVLGSLGTQYLPIGEARAGERVRDYILDHPEILPQAMDRLQQREMNARLAPMQGDVQTPFPGAILGNARGTRVLVEFSDYACGYCRQSLADVEALIAADPQLKVVIREYPILSPDSLAAARMALAAAEQGKFAAFHKAMFAAGRPSAATIRAAANKAELDIARAEKFAASAAVDAELRRTMQMAETLGFSGTPSWVAGGQALAGAVGRERLAHALKQVDPARQ